MTATKKQIKANQQNAKKSTGPKTEEGKAVVSQNGTKFGLFSKKIVVKSKYHVEDRVDYELLIEDLRSELNPQTFFQEYLIKKIANTIWRTQRVALAETAYINDQLDKIDDKIEREKFLHNFRMRENKNLEPLDFSSTETPEFANLIGIHSIPDEKFSKRILYYEMRLDKQLARTYHMLRSVQRREEEEQQKRERENRKTEYRNKKYQNDQNTLISKSKPNSF